MLDNLPRGTIVIEELEVGMTRHLQKQVTDHDIALFAEVSTDRNPVHLDDDYARDTIFEGRIAHGMLTAGLISAVIGEQLPGHGTVYLGQTLKFMAPVRPRDAERILGHLHRIEGEVVHGDKRGRQFGWPTANMRMDDLHLPRLGVYAVVVDVLTGPDKLSCQGVASLGVRPMFGRNAPNLEVHLFDFDGDLYGQHLSVGLVEFLRDEARFDSVQALIDQIAADADQARTVLAGA